jgi:hypothetical protein
MLTPDEVLDELRERGYEIGPRRLVDWRQKELLPPLVKRGRGQGRGWAYGWDDSLIVEQVIAVQELLWMHERTSWLYVPLWCLGFDVPLERVKARLVAMVERRQSSLTGGEKDPDVLADRLSELAVTLGIRPGPRRGYPRMTAEAAEYWLNLLAGDADYAPESETLEEIAADLWRLSGRDALVGISVDAWRLSELDLDAAQQWTRQYAAIPRLVEAAGDATEDEWAAVHADWQALAAVAWATGEYAEDDAWDEFAWLWRRVVAVAGPWLTLVDLSMRQHGRATLWNTLRKKLWEFTERLKADPELQHQSRLLWQQFSVSGGIADSNTG